VAKPDSPEIICVALNPAVDRTLEVHGLELGQHARGRLVSRQPAGKAVNVARVLGHLGRPCILTGFVGEAEQAWFEQSFRGTNVRPQLFSIAQPTRENVTLVDPDNGRETHIRDEGSEVSDDDQARLMKELRILARPETWMVFAGSLPRGLGVSEFRQLIEAVTEQGARVVLDSSEGALGVVGRAPLWLMKPNREELAQLSGAPSGTAEEIVAAAARLGDAVEQCLVSAGPDGCYLQAGGAVIHAWMKRMPGRVTNTVGCGDALLAGFLNARAAGGDDEACVRAAVATGTSASFQLRAGEVDPAECHRLAARVTVERINPAP
jgi:1-phosphofructokinase family hexose kinase